MKRLIIAVLALALTGAEKPKSKGEDPELRYACGRKGSSARKCQCSKQMMEYTDAVNEQCDKEADLLKCQERLHKESCAVIAEPDLAHPSHSCQRWCRRDRAACMCAADEPACFAPEIVPYEGDPE